MSDIRPQTRNANRHTQRGMQALERSIADDGWIGAITVAADWETFDGSARVEKTAENGMLDDAIVIDIDGTKPVVLRRVDIPSADDPRAKRLGVAANRVAALNLEWEPDVLAELAKDIDLSGLFTADEWADVALAEETQDGAGGDDFDTTPDDGPTRTQVGDLWVIGGKHRLLVGDCTDPANVARLMGGERAAAVITDPPYNVGADGRHDSSYEIDVGKSAEFEHFDKGFDPLPFLDTVKEFLSPNHNWFIFTLTYLAWSAYLPYLYALYDVASLFVWGKHFTFNNVRGVGFAKAYELGVYAWNKGHYFEALTGTDNYDMVVMSNNQGGRSYEHPTAKPIALIERLMRQLCPKDAIALDTFLGSGTAIIAAHRTGRRCYGMEISPRYADVILRRAEAEGLECVKADD